MKPFRKILVPLDFSKHSARALQVAARLACEYDGRLELVHVFESADYASRTGFGLTRPQLDDILARLEAELHDSQRAACAAGAPDVHTHVRRGPCAAEIVALAEEGRFDLIVMGTHGRSGLSRMLLGSVAERVLRAAPCPVLTVKAEEPPAAADEASSPAAAGACCSG